MFKVKSQPGNNAGYIEGFVHKSSFMFGGTLLFCYNKSKPLTGKGIFYFLTNERPGLG